MDALQALTNADVEALAVGLRSGRLGSPFSPMAIQRFCPGIQASQIVADLEKLAQQE